MDFALTWRRNLKLGDHVNICTVLGCKPATVDRTTPTQIIVMVSGREQRYMKHSGHRIGPIHGWIKGGSDV